MSKDPNANYYDAGGVETLDVIRAKLTPEQYRGYLLGNALKYLCRFNWKNAHTGDREATRRDAGKAARYANWLFEDYVRKGGAE